MKNKALSMDMVRVLAVLFLVACSGWGPLLVAETVEGAPAASTRLFTDLQYDVEAQVLAVTFADGSAYRYQQVPLEIYQDLQRIVNQGEYFAKHVRPRYVAERVDDQAGIQVARK